MRDEALHCGQSTVWLQTMALGTSWSFDRWSFPKISGPFKVDQGGIAEWSLHGQVDHGRRKSSLQRREPHPMVVLIPSPSLRHCYPFRRSLTPGSGTPQQHLSATKRRNGMYPRSHLHGHPLMNPFTMNRVHPTQPSKCKADAVCTCMAKHPILRAPRPHLPLEHLPHLQVPECTRHTNYPSAISPRLPPRQGGDLV